ncbi:hypothetical protein YC2023_044785 [Brassica napus]
MEISSRIKRKDVPRKVKEVEGECPSTSVRNRESELVKQGGRRYHVASADLMCKLVDLATGDVLQPLPSKLQQLLLS